MLVRDICDFLESPPKATFSLSSGLPAQRLQDLTQDQQSAAEAFYDEVLTELRSILDHLANESIHLPENDAPLPSGVTVLIEVSSDWQLTDFESQILLD